MQKNHLNLLFKEMGAFKVTMVLSIIVAAISSYVSLKAFEYIYKASEEVILHISDVSQINTELIKNAGTHILFCVVYMPLFYVAKGSFFPLRHRKGQGRTFATRISIEREVALWILGK